MKLDAPAPAAPAEPISEPANDAGFDDFGSEEVAPAPEGNSDKPFNDEPFDAGVDVDEDSDPKKFIEKLTGKLGQSLRKYTETQGQPDFELEKFAINSLISATHTSQMEDGDKNDIIKKINTAGNDDEGVNDGVNDSDEGANDTEPTDDGMGDDLDFGGEDEISEVQVLENTTDGIFVDAKKMSMFAPEDSAEFMEQNRMSENIQKDLINPKKKIIFAEGYLKNKLKETFNQEEDMENSEPDVAPAVKPMTKPSEEPTTKPSRRNKPFLPMPEVQPNPKAMNENMSDVYFNTYSGAVQAARQAIESKGFEINQGDWEREITFGSGKPKGGETRSHVIGLSKNGKEQRKALAIQVYNRGVDGKTYELNFYVN